MNKFNFYCNHPRLRLRKNIIFDEIIHHLNKINYKLFSSNNLSEKSIDQFDFYNCIFIHIPKSAGISINNTLFGNLGSGHIQINWFLNHYHKRRIQSFYKFTIVRNPWDRLFSAYNFLKKGGINSSDQKFNMEVLSAFDDFDSFVKGWVSKNNIYSYWHFVPQYEYIINQKGEICVDFIGKFENLEVDFKTIVNNVFSDREKKLEKKNITNSKKLNYKDYYTKESISIVGDVYKKDIEYLKYSF